MALTKIDDRGLKTPIDLLDNEKIRLGTDNDLEIYHASGEDQIRGTGTKFEIRSPNLQLQNSAAEKYIVCTSDGSVDLYHDNHNVAETNAAGLVVGRTNSTNAYITMRTSAGDAGFLYADSNTDIYLMDREGHSLFRGTKDGQVRLFYDHVEKISTTSAGVTISGSLICQDTGEYQVVLKDSNNTGNAAEAAIGFKGNDDAVLGLVGMNYWGDGNLDIQNNLSGGTISFETHNGTAVGERMRIDSSGRVGIGTSALSSYNGSGDDLVIDNGAADVGITLDSETQCGIAFTDSAKTGWDGWIKYVHSDNHLEFAANSSPRLTINSSGHISMGAATAPLTTYHGNTGTLFTIYDPNANAGVVEIAGDNNTNGYNAGSLAFINNNNSDGSTPWSAGSKYVALIRAQLYTSDSNAGDDSGADLVFYRKNEAAAGTEGMRIKHNGDVSLANGNLIVASGKGIDFSAQTASSATGATADGELLDHFEEGTWTPVQPTVGWYSGAEIEGKYQRVGDWVTATFIVKFPTNGSGIQALIDGLPFVSGGGGSATRHGGTVSYTTDSNVYSFLVGNGQDRIYTWDSSGGAVQLSPLDDDEVRGTVIYKVA